MRGIYGNLQFFYADESLNDIASELDSFDGRRDPERCNVLVNKLRVAQDRVLHIISEMLVALYPRDSDRACRDFRVKFPDEIIHDSLPGQLWFGAECLAAGSNIIDHEYESDLIRPLAKDLTRHLDSLRDMLKDQSLRDPSIYTDHIKDSLLKFDHLFSEFEFRYVSAMVPVKTVLEHDAQQDVLEMAVRRGLLTRDQVDYCDPIVMIVIPRLAIVWGMLHFPEGALNIEKPDNLSQMFRPNLSLLTKIRNLLRVLTKRELAKVECVLCSGATSTSVDEEEVLTMKEFRNKRSEDTKEAPSPSHEREEDSNKDEGNESTSEEMNQEEHCDCATSGEDEEEEERGCNSPAQEEEDEEEEANGSSGSSIATDEDSEYETAPEVHRLPNDCEPFPADPYDLRSRFRSSEDLVHRLFVCIAGVLKLILQPTEVIPVYEVKAQPARTEVGEEEVGVEVQESLPLPSFIGVRWVPDSDCTQCTACTSPFTVVRRRHHCRNCGRIFCNRCSAHSICIPELGYERKVRVCNLCYLHRMNPFGNCAPTNSATVSPIQPSATPPSGEEEEDILPAADNEQPTTLAIVEP
ncbi:lst-2 [Pristionchus pacificus]|uniref:Lst-2 n=1 Tax=Pristionchus pacificus TaxID=54126 RepID=A0A2A6BCL7_PRIPA|nr:lst-2 [Pristionchus pacificus]|eukprot:PDM63632.1 lst-2 [Pristionchus pacificus]